MLAISCLAITSMSNIDVNGISLWIQDFLAKVFVLGIMGLMFVLMPIRYLDGYKLRRWSWRIWTLVYFIISLLFIHVLVFMAYNHEHRHCGIGMHTPASVHFGTAEQIRTQRQDTLNRAYAQHPQRFARRPRPPTLPNAAWINQPADQPQPTP